MVQDRFAVFRESENNEVYRLFMDIGHSFFVFFCSVVDFSNPIVDFNFSVVDFSNPIIDFNFSVVDFSNPLVYFKLSVIYFDSALAYRDSYQVARGEVIFYDPVEPLGVEGQKKALSRVLLCCCLERIGFVVALL
jgi:hypothetical protein